MPVRLNQLLLAGVTAAAVSAPASAQSWDNIITFSDSASDAGNLQLLLSGVVDPVPAAAGYFNGRFSNGPTLADQASLRFTGELSRPSLAGGDNYAFGGATIVPDIAVGSPFQPIPAVIPDLPEQVAAYLGRGVDSSALHLLHAGNNDTIVTGIGFAPLESSLEAIGSTLRTQLDSLAAAGARDFLVSTTFAGTMFPTGAQINERIIDAAAEIAAARPETTFYFADITAMLATIEADPQRFGIDPALRSTPCFSVPGAAPECSGYETVDGIHEVASIFALVGEELETSVRDQWAAPRTLAALTEQSLFLANERADRLLRREPRESGRSVFVDASYSDLERDAGGNALGFSGDALALQAGIAIAPTPGLELQLGLQHTRAELSADRGPATRFDGSSLGLFALARLSSGPWQLGALLSAAQEEIDNYQRQVDAARRARGDTEGDSLTAALELAYTVDDSGWRPRAGIRYLESTFDGFEERGAQGLSNLNGRVAGLDNEMLLLTAGVDWQRTLAGGADLTLWASYEHLLDGLDTDIEVALVRAPALRRRVAVSAVSEAWGRLGARYQTQLGGLGRFTVVAQWWGDADAVAQYQLGIGLERRF